MSNHVSNTNTILIIGATSGIGKELALKFHAAGKTVIITGRRQANLDEITSGLNNERIHALQWDVSDLAGIKSKAEYITNKWGKDLNAVLIVSGIQRSTDFTKPEALNFDLINLEITTNYTSYIHIFAAFLPLLSSKPESKPWLGAVTSSLALVPIIRVPNYNATKAALHQLILTMRAQLESVNSPVTVVEIYPPAVRTELHAAKHQPDLADHDFGMPLDEFIEHTWAGLEKGLLDIPVGIAKDQWEMVDKPRQELFRKVLDAQAKKDK